MGQKLVPPHDIEAEQSVIGAMMLDPRCIDDVNLLEADFYMKHHRLVFKYLKAMAAEELAIDAVTASSYIDSKSKKDLESIGGLAYLGTLAKDTPSAANVRGYAATVKEKSADRQIILFARDIAKLGYSREGMTSAELIAYAEDKLYSISVTARRGETNIINMSAGLKLAMDSINETQKLKSDELSGETTGFDGLDGLTDGFHGGDLIIVAGRPGMGKSICAGNFEAAFFELGKPVGSFSLEMPALQVMQRHVSRASGVELRRVKRSVDMLEEDWARIGHTLKPMKDKPFYITDEAGLSLGDIVSTARVMDKLARKEFGKPLALITIDYLQLMSFGFSQGGRSTADMMGDITRGLKSLAKKMNVPVVLLSQLNRSLENRPNKRPVPSDLRDSGAIESDADIILFPYRDWIYHPDTAQSDQAELIVAKHRNGPTGVIPLGFDGSRVRFTNLDVERGYGFHG